MADLLLYPLKYLIAGFLLLIGWLAFWLVATIWRAGKAALRWCGARRWPMADIAVDFGDAVQRTAHDLASMEGVDLAKASPAVVRLWEARGLALHHLAAGDVAEAQKVIALAAGGAR